MEAITACCVIASFGDEATWEPLAERAHASAHYQTVPFDEIVRLHQPDATLQQVRNEAASLTGMEWLCFLDADDELDPRYREEMDKVGGGIKRPATLGIVDGVEDDAPVMIPRSDLRVRNCIVIGAFIRRADFWRVGGFGEDLALEDWDLFIRLHLDGAEIVDVPNAIYRVHVRPASRNSPQGAHHRVYGEIKNRYRERWNSVKERATHADT